MAPGVSLHDSKVRSGILQVGGRLLAALCHHIVGDALTFVKGPHSGAFQRADVHKHVAGPVARNDESKAFWVLKNFTVPVAMVTFLALLLLQVEMRMIRFMRSKRSSFWGGLISAQSGSAARQNRKPSFNKC
jgi:hypothetical protein